MSPLFLSRASGRKNGRPSSPTRSSSSSPSHTTNPTGTQSVNYTVKMGHSCSFPRTSVYCPVSVGKTIDALDTIQYKLIRRHLKTYWGLASGAVVCCNKTAVFFFFIIAFSHEQTHTICSNLLSLLPCFEGIYEAKNKEWLVSIS